MGKTESGLWVTRTLRDGRGVVEFGTVVVAPGTVTLVGVIPSDPAAPGGPGGIMSVVEVVVPCNS